MALPALKFDPETVVEERIARLEANVEHIQSDILEMKSDIREVRKEVQDVRKEMHASFATVEASLTALKVGRAIDKIWWLLIAAGLLGVMAKGFKWI